MLFRYGKINKKSAKLDKITEDLLYSTTENYIDHYPDIYNTNFNDTFYISLEVMMENGFLEEKILNKYNKNVLSKDTIIKVVIDDENINCEIYNKTERNLGEVETILSGGKTTYRYLGGKFYSRKIDNNFVEFNNMIYKILGKNSDGSIRLMLFENATTMVGSKVDEDYTTTYARKWINNEFYNNINYNDYVKKTKWCLDNEKNSNLSEITNCNNIIEDYVGMLSYYESNHGGDNNALSNNYLFMTLTKQTNNEFKIVLSNISITTSSKS